MCDCISESWQEQQLVNDRQSEFALINFSDEASVAVLQLSLFCGIMTESRNEEMFGICALNNREWFKVLKRLQIIF